MSAPSLQPDAAPVDAERENTLRAVIEDACGLLPIPGPITAFAFLNTLQALEKLPFDTALRIGSELYDAEPYLPEQSYRAELARNRIDDADLTAVLQTTVSQTTVLQERPDSSSVADVAGLTTRFDLRLAMLRSDLQTGPPAELRWFIAETDALRKFRDDAAPAIRTQLIQETRRLFLGDVRRAGSLPGNWPSTASDDLSKPAAELSGRFDEATIDRPDDATWESVTLHALWRTCRDGVEQCRAPAPRVARPTRPRDALLHATGRDCDLLVHPLLIRFCAAFVDQGFAAWPLPEKQRGFFHAFLATYGDSARLPDRWLKKLPQELRRLASAGLTPLESIRESLDLLGVPESERRDFVTATLLALRGWAGIIWQLETRGDRVPFPVRPGTLTEFLAVRLVLDRLALRHVADETRAFSGPLAELPAALRNRSRSSAGTTPEQRAFVVFQLAQVMGWSPAALGRLTGDEWRGLLAEIEAFDALERRALLHAAYERDYFVRLLDAVAVAARRPPARVAEPRLQAVFCLDAREESFRRHLEETEPAVETFGVAGFYGVAMYYRGSADARFSALCPVVVQPKTWVTEEPLYTYQELDARRAKARQFLGSLSRHAHLGSRAFTAGAILSSGVGVLASVPLVARVLFPRLAARVRRTAARLVEPPPVTQLRLERTAATPGVEPDEIGFCLEEMADLGERQLRDMGLTDGFARLVFIFGHGSFCLNNPHKSTYDCGACSGTPGGPNGRALAAMLNDQRVRGILAARGLNIPSGTRFVGALHNTGYDSITYYDLDQLPATHRNDFKAAERIFAEVCRRNAHERCRRFESAPADISLEAAHRHVEDRCEDLAQTRPEYGNATNASCFVGRRERVRGLFLDRRCFLTSYDPTADDERSTILARILGAAVPVCEGINMQYFLSRVDSKGWACGTKLPHNVASLLGVMDGAAGDLRPGLPWQSVEIHEPLRLQFIIETTPDAVTRVMDDHPVVRRIFYNGWSHLAVLDPHTAALQVFQGGRFHPYRPTQWELPQAPSSIDWYRGRRDHLGFAMIGPRE